MPENALIVDNDFFFAKFLGDLLKEKGYDVSQAYGGKQGIAALEDRMADYVFVNIIMPRIDGRQFIDYIREKYSDADLLIIGMSDSIIELRELKRDVGADYYFQKQPVESMTNYVDKFMEFIEGAPVLSSADSDLFNQEKVFRRQATVELLESLIFQRGIVESAGMGIIVLEKDARIILANTLSLDILNQPISNMLSRRITSVFPPVEKKKILKGLKAVAQNTQLERYPFAVVVNGAFVQVTASLLRVDGEIEGWILMLDTSDSLEKMD